MYVRDMRAVRTAEPSYLFSRSLIIPIAQSRADRLVMLSWRLRRRPMIQRLAQAE